MTAPALTLLTREFGRIGLLSFGGPAAQIALMHRVLVEERGWLGERQFLSALSFCMLLPGPEAMQLATYAGWRLRGTIGGLIAGGLFVLPGAMVIALLAALYAGLGERPEAAALMLGVKATVIVIVLQALIRLWRKALTGPGAAIIALLSFAALYIFSAPFPAVIALAALAGWLMSEPPHPQPEKAAAPDRAPALPWRLLGGVALWLAPLPLLLLAGQRLLFDLGLFFAKLAVMSFGGAYALLAWMAQEVVETRAWLRPEQVVDALGLAETTPGPLILVTQFIGQTIGQEQGGWAMAAAASALTLWMTFLPCFLLIFAFAPHLERLLARPRLQGALSAITAAVLGVIANLSLWFALHVLFGETRTLSWGAVLPLPETLRPEAVALSALAAILLLVLKRSVLLSLAITAACGLLLG